MKKYLLMFAFILPLMAQEVEVKETDGKTEVTVKKQYDKKKWNRGDMKRGMDRRDKRMMMAKRREMRKKRVVRSFVRVVVIGGVAYYVGYKVGQDAMKKGHKGKRPIWMGDREKK